MLSGCLATGNNLKRRHITQNDLCRRCCNVEETEEHIFFGCPYATGIWRASGLSNLIINNPTATLEEKIEACLQYSFSTRLTHFQDLPLWILWRLWKSRNMLVFQQKDILWRAVLRYAKEDANEWKQSDLLNIPNHSRGGGDATLEENKKWKRPPLRWIKCNTDGSFRQQLGDATAGWILRDENGVYKGSVQARGKQVQNALESELHAILMAIQHCWSLDYKQMIMESDCQKAIDILNNKKLHFNHYNWIRDIR